VDPTSDEVNPANPAGGDLTGRIFPQFAINWRYPWVRHDGGIRQVIEPIAQVVVGPNGANPGEIPNEDSRDFEFDDTNLFNLNRFTGIDRVDPGTRFDYGLAWTIAGDGGGYSSAFIGQSYRWRNEGVFAKGSGLEGDFSDIVGRIQVRPSYGLDLTYRFRFDKDDLRARRSELDLRIGPPILNLSLEHIFIDSTTSADEFDDREELNWTLRSQFSPRWSTFAGHRFDLAGNQSRRAHVGVNYKDECFSMRLVAERNFFADREITPEYTIFFNFVFKHLGGISSADILGN
jgi:LPS-assembly protein